MPSHTGEGRLLSQPCPLPCCARRYPADAKSPGSTQPLYEGRSTRRPETLAAAAAAASLSTGHGRSCPIVSQEAALVPIPKVGMGQVYGDADSMLCPCPSEGQRPHPVFRSATKGSAPVLPDTPRKRRSSRIASRRCGPRARQGWDPLRERRLRSPRWRSRRSPAPGPSRRCRSARCGTAPGCPVRR